MTSLIFVTADQTGENFESKKAFASLITNTRQEPLVKLAQEALKNKDCEITKDEFVAAFAGSSAADSAAAKFDSIFTRFRSEKNPKDQAYITPDEVVDLWKEFDKILPTLWLSVTKGDKSQVIKTQDIKVNGVVVGKLTVKRRSVPLGAFDWLNGLEFDSAPRGDFRPTFLLNARLTIDKSKLDITGAELDAMIGDVPRYVVGLVSVVESKSVGTDGGVPLNYTKFEIPGWPADAENIMRMEAKQYGNTFIRTWSTTAKDGDKAANEYENYNERLASDAQSTFWKVWNASSIAEATSAAKDAAYHTSICDADNAGNWNITDTEDEIIVINNGLGDIPCVLKGGLSLAAGYYPNNADFANKVQDSSVDGSIEEALTQNIGNFLSLAGAFVKLKAEMIAKATADGNEPPTTAEILNKLADTYDKHSSEEGI